MTDEEKLQADVQSRTCWCCKLVWASPERLGYHLETMATRIAEQREKLRVEVKP